MTRRTLVALTILVILLGVILLGYERMIQSEVRSREAALTALAEDTSRDIAQILVDSNFHDEATREARIMATLEKSSRAFHPAPQIFIDSNGTERQCKLMLTRGKSVIIHQDGSVVKHY
jgi:hypothetical protein